LKPTPVAKKESPHSFGGVFQDHRVWMMSAIYFCFVMGQYGLTFWMPTLVKATGAMGHPNRQELAISWTKSLWLF
jgi:hypothetical protein